MSILFNGNYLKETIFGLVFGLHLVNAFVVNPGNLCMVDNKKKLDEYKSTWMKLG